MSKNGEASAILSPSQLKILVCCHKPCELPKSEYLLPVHVGAALSDLDLEMQRDDEVAGHSCDNISDKNPNYCELTAMYWAWKNIRVLYPDLKYIGLNHYRRYFAFGKRAAFNDKITLPTDDVSSYKLEIGSVSKLLQRGNAILPKEKVYPYSLAVDYSCWNLCKDLRVLYEVIHDIAQEYESIFIDKMCKENAFSMYNMFILPWSEFDEYCSWLFQILFEVESRINIDSYDSNYARIYGYMSERLINVWLAYRGIDIKHVPVCFYDDGASLPVSRMFIRQMRARAAFLFTRPLNEKSVDAFFRYPNG